MCYIAASDAFSLGLCLSAAQVASLQCSQRLWILLLSAVVYGIITRWAQGDQAALALQRAQRWSQREFMHVLLTSVVPSLSCLTLRVTYCSSTVTFSWIQKFCAKTVQCTCRPLFPIGNTINTQLSWGTLDAAGHHCPVMAEQLCRRWWLSIHFKYYSLTINICI